MCQMEAEKNPKLNQGSERYIYIYKKRASKRIGAALGQKKR